VTNDIHDLELLLRSRVPLIVIETRDEKRVKQLFTKIAIKLTMPVMAWSATTGLQRIDFEATPQVMAEKVARLRAWAATRTVSAN